MKKIRVVVFIASMVCIAVFFTLSYFYQTTTIEKNSDEILQKTYQLIQNSNNTKELANQILANEDMNKIKQSSEVTKENIILDDEIIGVLIIPKLNIEAPIKDGTSQNVMKNSIGHFIESDYWNGNVSLASHNGGTYAHYFEHINTLQENDEIEYITKLGNKKYKVEKVFQISSFDWTEVMKNTDNSKENTITLITCINGKPNYRLCVKGTEI